MFVFKVNISSYDYYVIILDSLSLPTLSGLKNPFTLKKLTNFKIEVIRILSYLVISVSYLLFLLKKYKF